MSFSERTDKTKVNRNPGGSEAHPGLGFGAMMPNTCPQRGVVWYNNMILDTGTPMGGAAYKGAPAAFVNCVQLYRNHNVVFEKGNAVLYPANNGMATGPGMQLLSCPNGSDTPVAASMGGVGGNGGTPQQLGCPQGNRTMNVKLGNMNLIAVIDTGTPALPISGGMMRQMGMSQRGMMQMRGGGVQMMMATFEPNPTPSPIAVFQQGSGNGYCPVYWISQAVRIILTSQYTILQSLGMDAKSIYYSCQGGGRSQMGDPLMGKWKM